ncbi:unnamed protein product [Haemonchus placei]|uniref:Secreted protein n=1 Tax=Haemonchus placei TaxID=6290 RepID=A0A0N4X7J8_HAEPC|nr:unnamed protein product [Haemonchus placei]
MERLFLVILIIGAIAVGQLVPPSKYNGTGNEHADITLRAILPDANRRVEEETEIRNNASRLGTVKRLLTWHDYFTTYILQLVDTDCSKVEGWLKDIVRNTKAFTFASLSCRPMNITYYPYDETYTYITKTTIQKFRQELEPLWI